MDENRYEQKKDRKEKKDRERAGGKTVMLSEAKHLYIRIEMGLCGVKDPSLALRMTEDGSGGQRESKGARGRFRRTGRSEEGQRENREERRRTGRERDREESGM